MHRNSLLYNSKSSAPPNSVQSKCTTRTVIKYFIRILLNCRPDFAVSDHYAFMLDITCNIWENKFVKRMIYLQMIVMFINGSLEILTFALDPSLKVFLYSGWSFFGEVAVMQIYFHKRIAQKTIVYFRVSFRL